MKKRRAAMEVIDVRLNVTFLVVLYAGIYEDSRSIYILR